MEFKAKVWEQIVFKMILFYKSISKTLTDFSVGSTIRTLFESVAFEIEELYLSIKNAIDTAIRESIYVTFGFERRPSIRASTTLTVTFYTPHEAFTIPKGTRFSTTEGVTFATVADCSVEVDETSKDLLVICTTSGSLGNVPADSITKMVDYINFIKTVTNPEAVTNGRNLESDASRKNRFVTYIQSLGKGTIGALQYAVSTIPEISSVSITESLPGIVKVYVSTITGDVSEELLNNVRAVIDQYRAAGIQVFVSPISKIVTDVSVKIYLSTLENSSLLVSQVKTGITNYLNSMNAGEDFIPNNLIGFIFSLNRSWIKNVELLSPTERINVADYSLIRPGTITVTAYLEEDL